MPPLPVSNLRTNVATWAVPACRLPAVAYALPHLAPTEGYDPTFRGQELLTTYFDTQGLLLRKARLGKQRYLTLRLRCYEPDTGAAVYALSAKTEAQKWRQEVAPEVADAVSAGTAAAWTRRLLPPDLLARLLELAGDEPLLPACRVCCRRYAVESDRDRFTLDADVRTDAGKVLPFAVLEYKSADPGAVPPGSLAGLGLWPLKLSKFLWATGV
jgi:hypothetical protein